MKKAIFFLLILACAWVSAFAQTNEITYQGKLTDGANPANGSYDMQFQLYSQTQLGQVPVGSPLERLGVPVANGVFTVTLDFSSISNSFTGATRLVGISVRPAGSGAAYTPLTPAQKITSAPYAIRSQNAENASTATNSTQLGGVAAGQYVITSDSRMSDARQPLPGSGDYVQNTTVAQASSNFNITGDGTAGGTLRGNVVSATTGFDIGSTRVLSVRGTNNTMVGENAGGSVLSPGNNNTMVGFAAGDVTSGGFNSFVGSSAGAANTTGVANSFFGALAGNANTTGLQNSFFGRGAGSANTTADGNSFFGAYSGNVNTAADNSFFGSMTGLANTTGFSNSFFGADAGKANIDGHSNSFFGARAGTVNTGNANSFYGAGSGEKTTSATGNSFFGFNSGWSNTTGYHNSFFGSGSGMLNTVGQMNSFFGVSAGRENTSGDRNSYIGYYAGMQNTAGSDNVFVGYQAGYFNTSGNYNTFLGFEAGRVNSTGNYNVAIGYQAGKTGGTAGTNNIVIGRGAQALLTGSNNTAIGAFASIEQNRAQDGSPGSLTYATAIGAGAQAFFHNSIWLGRETGEDTVFIPGTLRASSTVYTPLLNADRAYIPTSLRIGLSGIGSDSVCLSSNGTFAICVSSLRYKTNVNTFTGGLDLVKRLKPITFDWTDSGKRDLGFGAEEVAAVEPLLGRYDEDGNVQGVKYDRVGAVLVNAVNEQQNQIEALKSQIEQQKAMIESLKQLVCAQNPQAEVCREEEKK